MPKTKTKKRSPYIRWTNRLLVDIFRLAQSGYSNHRIARAIGADFGTFKRWYKKRSSVRYALEQARAPKVMATDFLQYVFNQLSPEMQEVWERIQRFELEPTGLGKIEAMMERQGKSVRQHLFLHAMVAKSFNVSEACRAVSISLKTFNGWVRNDPDFCELMQEMDIHKKNFFEAALVDLVGRRDTSATIFANRTYNRDRGYGDKLQVEHTGSIEHNVRMINFSELDLPVELMRQVLEHVRRKRPELVETTTLPALEVYDVE